jgi:hypothetical protein
MSLIYRAMWQDDRADLHDVATATFVEWATKKHDRHLDFGPERSVADNGITTSLRTVEHDGVTASEAVLIEETGPDRWLTRQRTLVGASGDQWLWVDIERTTTEVFRRQDIAAPRVVRAHLDAANSGGGRPRVGSVPLRTSAVAVPAGDGVSDLVESIRDGQRSVPIVVFTHNERLAVKDTMDWASTTQLILAGVARVVVLPPDAVGGFTELLGKDLSVWDGAVRVYLPGPLEPWRHRYYLRDIVAKHPREVGRRIANSLSGSISARRAPQPYEAVRTALRGAGSRSTDDLLQLADLELEERDLQIDELRSDLQSRDDQLLDRAVDIEELNEELEAERRKTRYWMHVAIHGADTAMDDGLLPERATTLSEAAAFCQAHLPLVSLPDSAIHDLEQLDSAPEATAWAQTSWRGFRALQAYASEAATRNGGFFEWCQHTSHADNWPATSKKVSMSESESVMNNKAQRAARYLPVVAEISPDGRIEMFAHLKVAEGGGNNIPRIYFHDDTKGATGKVHVGFFGPHVYMENTKT